MVQFFKKNNKDIFVGRLKEKHVEDAQGKAMDFLLVQESVFVDIYSSYYDVKP